MDKHKPFCRALIEGNSSSCTCDANEHDEDCDDDEDEEEEEEEFEDELVTLVHEGNAQLYVFSKQDWNYPEITETLLEYKILVKNKCRNRHLID